ncbi:MAG: DUF655 domain-containing protein [Candidatus Micrarchaeota archaeon]
MREDYAIVLDYLPNGYASSFKKEPVVQALGEKYFSLLELVARPGISINLGDKIYIGAEKREQVQFIKGKLEYRTLTATARNELKDILDVIVAEREAEFVNFFNKAGSVTVRQHTLELIPNIGKKHMWDIINEREKKPFESYKDIADRVKLMPDPKRVIVERIIEELQGYEKHYLFIKSLPKNAVTKRGGRYR